jgi:phosphatidylethanolamine/phosphatidyl-N-methylethanolamine N-methyltransferase
MKMSEILNKEVSYSYEHDYANLVESGFLSKWVYIYSHKSMERGFSSFGGGRILELGAQSDQHRRYVSVGWDEYVVSDINLSLLTKAKLNHDFHHSSSSSNVKFEKIDATNINYDADQFDRLIATCLIAHMNEPIDALSEWRRVVKHGGYLSIYIACEPSLLLRFARTVFRKRTNRKSNFDFDLLQYYQHTISYPAILEFVKFVFKNDSVKIKKFPFNFFPWDLNFWAIATIKINKNEF